MIMMDVILDGDGCWPDLKPEPISDIAAMAYLSNGTNTGKPAILLRIQMPDGRVIVAQTTLRLFMSAAAAFAGKAELDGLEI